MIFGAEQEIQVLVKRDIRCSPHLEDRSLGGTSTQNPSHGQAEVQQNSLQLIMHEMLSRQYTQGSGCSVGGFIPRAVAGLGIQSCPSCMAVRGFPPETTNILGIREDPFLRGYVTVQLTVFLYGLTTPGWISP